MARCNQHGAVVGQSDVGQLELLTAGPEVLGHRCHSTRMPDSPPSAWPYQYQDQPGLLGPIAREDHEFMTAISDRTTLPLTSGRWVVDTNHSSIGFIIRHLGVSKVRGRFTRFDADVIARRTDQSAAPTLPI
jgi:hypothetical protein